jgi:hypothetical protein
MKATAALAQSYSERRLADDFPALVAATEKTIPADVRRKIEELDDAGRKPGVFDTHPPDTSRIERARRERTAGMFRLEQPAAVLFGDLPGLCRRATEVFYRDEHEIDLAGVKLESTSRVFARQDEIEHGQEASERLFGPLVSVTRPLGLREELPPAPGDVAEVVQTLRESRKTLAGLADATRSSGKILAEAHTRAMELSGAHVVLTAGFQPTQGEGTRLSTPRAAERGAELARERAEAAEAELGPARAAARDRVQAALSLLKTPDVAGRLGEDASEATAAVLLRIVTVLGQQAPNLRDMVKDHQTVAAIMSVEPTGDDEVQRCLSLMSRRTQALRKRIDSLLLVLEPVPYPFEHAEGSVSLAAFVAADMPPDENELSAFLQGGHVLTRVSDIHARVHGRLAAIVEDVERAVGLEPLDPSPERPPTG